MRAGESRIRQVDTRLAGAAAGLTLSPVPVAAPASPV